MRPVLLLIAAAVGCSRADAPPPRGTVAGQVTLAGQPVSGAMIHFEDRDAGHEARVPLNADGTFVVKTVAGTGLPPGKYKVSVVPGRVTEPAADPAAGKPGKTKLVANVAIPAKYHTAATTDLTADVAAGENPAFAFDLKP